MPRMQETFFQPRGSKSADVIIIIILCLSLFSIGSQTFTAVDGAEKEKDRRAAACLKDFKDNDCNIYSPNEKCKPIVDCIKEADEPLLTELKTVAETGFEKIEKLSIIPLLIIGLVLLGKNK